MQRIRLAVVLAVSLVAAPLVAEGQQPGKALVFDTVEGPEHVPSLIIPETEILSVVVEPNGRGYRATIRLDTGATQQLHEFTERNIGKRVDIRFDGELLSTLRLVAPVPSGLVALDVGQSEPRITKVFGSLGSRLSWKRNGP